MPVSARDFAALIEDVTQDGKVTVRFEGDSRIRRSEYQLELIAAFCARSVADVMDAWNSGVRNNSFSSYVFDGPMGISDDTIPRLHQLVRFEFEFAGLTCSGKKSDRRIWIEGQPELFESVDSGMFPVAVDLLEASRSNPIFGAYVGMQGISESTGSHLRAVGGVERIVFADRPEYRRLIDRDYWMRWPEAWAISLGYSTAVSKRSHAHGGSFRFTVPFPKIDAQLSLMLGARHFSREDLISEWGDFQELRLGWGKHLVNIFVGVGRDHWAREDGKLVPGIAVSGGLLIALPRSRLNPRTW